MFSERVRGGGVIISKTEYISLPDISLHWLGQRPLGGRTPAILHHNSSHLQTEGGSKKTKCIYCSLHLNTEIG